MRVLAISPEELWLDLEAVARETALRELTMYKIGRRVEIADAGAERTVLSVIGPRAWDALQRAGVAEAIRACPRARWTRGRDDVVVVATDLGFDLLGAPAAVAGLTRGARPPRAPSRSRPARPRSCASSTAARATAST